ncbi:MAG: MFS transporter [Trueperaceae bacterium]|nr:MFS transporter [Trueperaceae bacterium]
MNSRTSFFYGWVIVAVTIPVLMITAGIRSAPGAWIVPMKDDLGWSIASLSFAAAMGLIVYGFSGPLSGNLMRRFGVRNVVIISMLLSGLSMLLSSMVKTQWQLTLFFGLFSGMATGLVASVLGATVATRWFVKHRGLVVGMMGAAVSAGQLVFFPLLTAWAVSMGWRTAALILAGLCVALVLPVLLFMRDDPEQIGLKPLGELESTTPAKAQADEAIMRRALKSPDFWLLALTFYICGATSNGLVGQHFIPHAVDHGFSAQTAANTLALMGAFNFIGTIASGWLTDRFDPRRLLLAYYGFRGLSLLFLPFIHDNLGIVAFAVLFGLDYIATVPPTIALAADTFGRKNVGVVYGWVFAAHQVGAALSAWVAGLARDSFGDYALAFYFAGAMAILGGLMALIIRRSSQVKTKLA